MLEPRTKELIGVAVSVVAKCQPCLDFHLAEARKAGATESEIGFAVNFARSIRKAGDENMDKFVGEQLGAAPVRAASGCSCGSDCGD